MHRPNPDPNPSRIEVSELNETKPLVFELTDRPGSEVLQQRDFTSDLADVEGQVKAVYNKTSPA